VKHKLGLSFLLLFGVLITVPAFSQMQIGYVNSDRIMQEWQPAQEAQQKLITESQNLNQQYNQMLSELDSLQQEFQRQQFVMSEERRSQKQQEIAQMQQKIQQFQMDNINAQGQLNVGQEEVLGPIMQQIDTAIRNVATNGGYDYVLDVARGSVLYAEEKLDITPDVLYELRRGGSDQ